MLFSVLQTIPGKAVQAAIGEKNILFSLQAVMVVHGLFFCPDQNLCRFDVLP